MRDFDQHEDAEVDLHEDEELVEGEENCAWDRLRDPLVTAFAHDSILRAILIMPVDHESSDDNDRDRDGTKHCIAKDEALCLLLK